MITMEPFEVYRAYLALRLHFTTPNYDVIKQQGRVRASKQSFFKRKDLFAINKISKEYSDKEVVDFLVANFVSGDRWGGVFDSEARETYLEWKKRIESITYTFDKDISTLLRIMEKNDVAFHTLFQPINNNHPAILKLYLRKGVSIETLVILNKLNKFVDFLDKKLDKDIVWPDVSRIIKKYQPFLKVDKEKYDGIIRRRIGSYELQDSGN